MTGLAAELRRELRGEVRDDAYTRHLFATDASMYAIEPVAVAFPRDGDDVATAVAVASRHDVPVIARGAGTSLAGQAVGGGGLVLDCSRHLTAVEALDPDARTAVVQPGVVQEALNRAAAEHGLGFGPDTSTFNRATLGGMIANNASGAYSIVHGTTSDHVLDLELVLADGSTGDGALGRRLRHELPELVRRHADAIATGFPRHWRQAGGYRLDRLARDPGDLARIVCGSEGTLALITRATVRLTPLPAVRRFAVGHFASVADAVAATGAALELKPSAVELIDHTILALSRAKREYRALSEDIRGDPGALLYVTFDGEDAERRLDALDAAWAGHHVLRPVTPAQELALTKVRTAGLGLLMAAASGTRRPLAFVEDTAVAPEHLPEYVARLREVLDRHGLEAGFYGHASAGCLHVRPYVDLREPGAVETVERVAEEVQALVASFGGTNASEHGDGRVRSPLNPRVFGPELYGAMREVKALFDPHGRLNPGVMVDAAPLRAGLRDPALPPAPPLATTLDFSEHGGMRGAADRCQRIGLCRKTTAGTMCPSFVATREEEHSTRGRANALVKALSAPDPRAALGDDRLHEILDLCLECKACASECPLSVDMTALKAEALHQRHATHGVPLRSRAFAAVRTLNRLGSAAAPLSNLPLPRRALGLAPERPLPRFTRDTLPRWFARRPARSTPAPRGDAVLLADSFTAYTEPAVARAAVELLEAGGWNVSLATGGCCGRAAISKGLLDRARREARAMVERLAPAAEAGVPIVGCEPSCLLTLTDEHPRLLPGDARARTVARHARLVEDLLLEADLPLKPGPPRVLLHGHCHQRALTGTAASAELLRRLPGTEVEDLDAGCCGMAGSFGYEREHYALSMRIGEDRLFPAVRAAATGTAVAATGVSCRAQIRHGTGTEAHHPVQLLRAALG